MDFKEYERRRDALTDKFVEEADHYRRSGDIDNWRQVRTAFKSNCEALYREWKDSSPEMANKVIG